MICISKVFVSTMNFFLLRGFIVCFTIHSSKQQPKQCTVQINKSENIILQKVFKHGYKRET